MGFEDVLAALGIVGATAALILSIIARNGVVAASRFVCKLVKADYDKSPADAQEKYGPATYCDFLNDPEFRAITDYCDKSGCN